MCNFLNKYRISKISYIARDQQSIFLKVLYEFNLDEIWYKSSKILKVLESFSGRFGRKVSRFSRINKLKVPTIEKKTMYLLKYLIILNIFSI